MDQTVAEHIRTLEARLRSLNVELMQDSSMDDRNHVEAEIRAADLALSRYKAALEIEHPLAHKPS